MALALIVIGASLGGLSAVETILKGLPTGFPAPVAIVLHRSADTKTGLSAHLQRYCALLVMEVEDKDEIAAGKVYISPADYHLLVEDGHFALSTDEPVLCARPSINVLFESAADAYGGKVMGVILTGASTDGSSGAARIKQRGGLVAVQDPDTAESDVLPKAVISSINPDYILPVNGIAPLLVSLCGTERRSDHV